MRGFKLLGRAVSLVLTAVLGLMLAGNLYTIAARVVTGEKQPTLFGYSTAIVISGSMSGSIEINDLVVIHEEAHYEPGDIVTFRSGESIVTHRIVERTAEGYITKGDANNVADQQAIPPEQIVGRVILVIPRIGIVQEYMSTPLGMMCVVVIGFLLIAGPSLMGSEASGTGGDDDEA